MEGISQDVVNSELLLFDPVRINRGAEQIQWIEYRPINQLSDEAPIEICIPGTGSPLGQLGIFTGQCLIRC